MTHTTGGEPSVGHLFGDLSRQVSTLVRQEIRLGATEMRTKVKSLGRDIAMLVAGAVLAFGGFLALVAALVLLLAEFMPGWVAAVIVGLVLAAGGYAVVQSGMKALQHEDLAPRETIRSIREDVRMAKEAA